MINRYSAWDGTQTFEDVTAEDVLDTIADDLLAEGDVNAALQRLHRWGMQGIPGLDDLRRRLRELRQHQLSRYNLDSTVDSLKQELDQIVGQEREGIQRRLDQSPPDARRVMERMARQRQERLDRLPEDLGGRVRGLSDYEFMDDGARERFQEFMSKLQQQMVDRMFQGMKQSLERMTAQDLDRVREMVKDLNQMLSDRAQGREPDFAAFKRNHGDLFPPEINSLEQLMEHLQRQMAQMRSLLRSMSPQARAELQQLAAQLLQDDGLRAEMARLNQLMDALMPPSEITERYPFFGEESLAMDQAMNLMESLQEMDRLESQLERGVYRPGDVDQQLAQRYLGPDARKLLEQHQAIRASLEEAGLIERRDRRVKLTPRAMRMIGQKALREVFSQLGRTRFGQHQLRRSGFGNEAMEELKEYEFGDPFMLDLRETLSSAVQRQGPGLPVRLAPGDFMIRRTEMTAQASTVLMIDMSRSMFLRGCFLAAKKVTIALEALIRSQFPRDSLYVVGFSNLAVELKAQSLPEITLSDYVYGTNMHHGFQLARQLLGRHRGNRQIVMITDGEPTAHLEGGRPFFAYPPTPRTIELTMQEVRACTLERITINTFMLDRSPYLIEFINHLTRVNHGRAFMVDPDRLGEYVLYEYLSGRRRHSAA